MLCKHLANSFMHNPILYMIWENMVSSCPWLRMCVIDSNSKRSWHAFSGWRKVLYELKCHNINFKLNTTEAIAQHMFWVKVQLIWESCPGNYIYVICIKYNIYVICNTYNILAGLWTKVHGSPSLMWNFKHANIFLL